MLARILTELKIDRRENKTNRIKGTAKNRLLNHLSREINFLIRKEETATPTKDWTAAEEKLATKGMAIIAQ